LSHPVVDEVMVMVIMFIITMMVMMSWWGLTSAHSQPQVWPDPLFPKVLVLASINGVSVRASTQVDLDNLETPITPLYSESHAMLVQKILSQVSAKAAGCS
jgi:hypothetical protein